MISIEYMDDEDSTSLTQCQDEGTLHNFTEYISLFIKSITFLWSIFSNRVRLDFLLIIEVL